MSTTKYTLSDSTKNALLKIRRKIELESNPAFFTPEDRAVMGAAYNELLDRTPCWGCSGFLAKCKQSLVNYFKLLDKEEMSNVIIEDRVLKPAVKENVTYPKSISDMSLKELREEFPMIKARSKNDFIKRIENGEEE